MRHKGPNRGPYSIILHQALSWVILLACFSLLAGVVWRSSAVAAPGLHPSWAGAGGAPLYSAGFDIWAIVSNPVFTNLVVLGAVAIYNRVMKANESTYRWQRISQAALDIVQELRASGWTKWEALVVRAMELIVEQTTADPGIKSLTQREVEALKPLVVSFAKRATGKVDVPMAPLPLPPPPR